MINKKDDDRRVTFINAQKTIGSIMCEKEQCLEGKNWKQQQVMDQLFKYLTKQSVASPVQVTSQVPKNE